MVIKDFEAIEVSLVLRERQGHPKKFLLDSKEKKDRSENLENLANKVQLSVLRFYVIHIRKTFAETLV